eukprot:m.278829 g.278829  ORF g.278829 m.278829 type:complete len:103 (-) comp17719_c0_seq2:166-474(-)
MAQPKLLVAPLLHLEFGGQLQRLFAMVVDELGQEACVNATTAKLMRICLNMAWSNMEEHSIHSSGELWVSEQALCRSKLRLWLESTSELDGYVTELETVKAA